MTDIQNRGVEDIFIACMDGLSGFKQAVLAVFPKIQIQRCVIHQIRNSLKYVSWTDHKAFMVDLRKVYQAATREAAEANLVKLGEQWGSKYAVAIRSWQNHWEDLATYFDYPADIRRLIYTTNTVEGYHRQIRKVTKNKGVFTNDTALEKLVYLAYRNIRKKWTMPLKDWGQTAQQLAILFPDRFKLFD